MASGAQGFPLMIGQIREQADLLRRLRERLPLAIRDGLGAGEARRLHLAGCGDMHFAAEQVAALARELWGVRIECWRSMELRWFGSQLGPGDLVICASVSGRTPRTIEAARLARAAGATVVGLTDNAGSPLCEAVDRHFVLATAPPEDLERDRYAGYQHVIPQTKTFLAVLYAELLLAQAFANAAADAALDRIPGCVEEAVAVLEEPASILARECLSGRDQVVVLGSGPHLPIARYGAAKMLEYAVPSLAQCLEEYNHLEVFVASPRTLVIVLASDRQSAHRAAELTAPWERLDVCSLVLASSGSYGGADTRVLTLPPGGDLAQTVFTEGVALQLLACRAAGALGRDPDRWLGGRRTDQIQELSLETIRGSEVLGE